VGSLHNGCQIVSRRSAQSNEQCDTSQEDAAGNKEMTIGEDCPMCLQWNRAPGRRIELRYR
jgi:hypothetical protein